VAQEEFDLGTDREEQETAWANNFSAVAIVEEEEDLIPPEANELKYVNVSHCLWTLWIISRLIERSVELELAT